MRVLEVGLDREESRGQRRQRPVELVLLEPLVVGEEPLGGLLGLAQTRCGAAEHARVVLRMDHARLHPRARLGHGGAQNVLDELRVRFAQTALRDEILVELRADGLRRIGLEVGQCVGDAPGALLLDVVEDERVPVRKQALLELETLPDRRRQQVGILRNLFARRLGKPERVLPPRPAGRCRQPPLRALVGARAVAAPGGRRRRRGRGSDGLGLAHPLRRHPVDLLRRRLARRRRDDRFRLLDAHGFWGTHGFGGTHRLGEAHGLGLGQRGRACALLAEHEVFARGCDGGLPPEGL